MYKVIFVDDEEIVREGIRDRIPWNRLGFELVGTAENGRDALQMVQEHPVDVVITDICMPYMDGLELTEAVKGIAPAVKIIIISGYDQFEYAQNAIKLGVQDYILKPLTSREVETLLQKVKKSLDEEKSDKDYLEGLQRQIKASLPLLRERFLNRLVCGPVTEVEYAQSCSYLSIQVPGPGCFVMVVDLDVQEEAYEQSQLMQFAVFNIASELAAQTCEECLVFCNKHGQTVIIMPQSSSDQPAEEEFPLARKIQTFVQEKLRVTLSIGVGNPVVHWKDLPVSYDEALHALEYRFLLGKNQLIHIADMEKQQSPFSRPVSEEKKLLRNIKVGTLEDTDQDIEAIFAQLEKSDIHRCKLYIQELIVQLKLVFYELGINQPEDPGSLGSTLLSMMDFQQVQTLAEIKEWLKRECKEAHRYIAEHRVSATRQLVEQAQTYLRDHYADCNISLSSVCRHLNVSVSYFSMIFKKEVGETFVEYLTKYRLEQAKHLLKSTDYKTYEIAEATGYSDPQYFSTVFKKQVGVSPSEYRAMVQALK